MTTARKIFLILSVVSIVTTLSGVLVLTGMEYQARAALPPEEQTVEAIYQYYDGAVCMSCDYGRVFIALIGSTAFLTVLFVWGVYETGSLVLAKINSAK